MNVGMQSVMLADDMERRRLAVLRRIVGAGNGTAVGAKEGARPFILK